MPSTITHAYFMTDVYQKLDPHSQILLKKHLPQLKIYAQSTDPFNFYKVLHIYQPKRKSIQKIAELFHHTKCNDFLIEMTSYIKKKNYQYHPDVIACLYGFISHYILDSTLHPYIIYKTGRFKKGIKETSKYNAKHHEAEAFLDQYLIEKKEEKKAFKYNIYQLWDQFIMTKETEDTLNHSFKKIYDIDSVVTYYQHSINDMKNIFRYLRYDPSGILNITYHIFNLITPKSYVLRANFLSYHYRPKNHLHYLNNTHKAWHNPYEPTLTYHYSFDELYEISITNCIKIIQEINKYLYTNNYKPLKSIYQTKSYVTGLEWTKEETIKKLEY